MVVTAVMALATDTERGPQMLRPSPRLTPGTATMVSTAMEALVLAMVVMAVTALATDTERGQLMLRPSPRPMPGWDMVDSTAIAVWVLAMVVMAVWVLAMVVMADTALATERGLLMLRLSPRLMRGTDTVAFTATESQPMAAMAMDLDSMARSK